jgi:glycosyltransferase involved in cell wall biosynthesis
MNILFINLEKAWRGGENQIYLLAKGLKQRGFSVSIAYPAKNTTAILRFSEVAEVIPLTSTSSLDFRNLSRLKKYCRTKNIKIIDANSSKAQSLALRIKKSLPNIKLVVHRRVVSPIKTNIFTRKKYLHPYIDSYVAISKSIAKSLLDYGVDIKKVKIITSAIQKPKDLPSKAMAKQAIAELFQVTKEGLWIGSAAALTEEKGLQDLIEFAAQLKKLKITFTCLIAGTGKLQNKLQDKITNLHLENEVKLLGFVEDVTTFLRALDVMVLCSRSEGLGTILLEAIHTDTVILATNVGGIPEIVMDNKTGRLYKPGNIKEGVEKLILLLDDESSRQRLCQNAKNHAEAEFSIESMLQKNYQNYLELLS